MFKWFELYYRWVPLIHSPWILKRLNVTHNVPLFTSDHICKRTLFFQAIHLNAQ